MEQLTSNKLCRSHGYGDLKDMIGELPDDVLVLVVSCLPLKDAARSSVLSRRWRHLWHLSTGSLYFDSPEVIRQLSRLDSITLCLDKERDRYVEWVNQVVKSHQSLTIDEFKVRFQLNQDHGHQIDKWIEFAFRKRVKKLELNFETFEHYEGMVQRGIKFPKFPKMSCLRHLTFDIGYGNNLLGLTSLIEASPSLEKFVLRLPEPYEGEETREMQIVKEFPNHKLKEVYVVNFHEATGHTELLIYLLKSAVKLEKITFDPHYFLPHLIPWESLENERARRSRMSAHRFKTSWNPHTRPGLDFIQMEQLTSNKLCCCRHGYDMISELPDDVLVLVLSCLPLKEAARTSVVSRRWRHLWHFSTGSFYLDQTKVIHQLVWDNALFPNPVLIKERDRYIEWANQVVESHQSLTIHEFKAQFPLNQQHIHCIDKWIEFALRKRVKKLELDLESFNLDDLGTAYSFPRECFSSCPEIKLLTSVCLTGVDVKDETVECFVSNCPLLETLYVSDTESLRNIKLCGSSSLRLKHLHLSRCYGMELIELITLKLSLSARWFIRVGERGFKFPKFPKIEVPSTPDLPGPREGEETREMQIVKEFPNQSLKEVHVVNFQEATSHRELVLYLLKSAVNLDKIIFDPRYLLLPNPHDIVDHDCKKRSRMSAYRFQTWNQRQGLEFLIL
ncbi:hypothetical protein COLO4_05517 [Corchorus olitorius]|uniref:F-box domain-containing protein n=1 Tax=Corchorus olitorius TaxID=93759 RepID=A0A1R3KQR7_9ROSI|nr:hypothetical protein COLO4_05517 [Corchorus olitorius]